MTNKDKIVDSWLVLRTRSGDNKALGLLVKRWHKKLCKQVYWYTRDMNDAKDIVQDCWPVIIRKIHTLKEPRNFGSWALSIVTRKALDSLRKNNREAKNNAQFYEGNSETIKDANLEESDNLILILRTSIKKLPEGSQMILNLFYLEELSIKQIGEILDLPQGTIKSRLFNAREKLKTIIKKKNHEK
jgi:RNA polymerase sigma-70 factor (ECF subfamily)